jgi:hypothetical protein
MTPKEGVHEAPIGQALSLPFPVTGDGCFPGSRTAFTSQ